MFLDRQKKPLNNNTKMNRFHELLCGNFSYCSRAYVSTMKRSINPVIREPLTKSTRKGKQIPWHCRVWQRYLSGNAYSGHKQARGADKYVVSGYIKLPTSKQSTSLEFHKWESERVIQDRKEKKQQKKKGFAAVRPLPLLQCFKHFVILCAVKPGEPHKSSAMQRPHGVTGFCLAESPARKRRITRLFTGP